MAFAPVLAIVAIAGAPMERGVDEQYEDGAGAGVVHGGHHGVVVPGRALLRVLGLGDGYLDRLPVVASVGVVVGEGGAPAAETPVPVVPPVEESVPVPGHVLGGPSEVEAAFVAGFRDAGGGDESHLWAMIECESGWELDSGGFHLGLAQWSPGTWANVSGRTGLTEWRDPYHQGYNVAVWISLVDEGSTSGWPVCWWAQ